MKDFLKFVEMATPRDRDLAATYYHGTTSLADGIKIMQEGLDPSKTKIKYGGRRSALEPQKGRVYITPRIDYAAIYAIGGSYLGSSFGRQFGEEEKWGVVVELPGQQFNDITPDEDQVGEFLVFALMKPEALAKSKPYHKNVNWNVFENPGMLNSFIQLGQRTLTPIQWRNAQNHWGKGAEVAFHAAIGKKLVKGMSGYMAHWLIDCGAHVAHHGRLMPSRGWRIDKNRSAELAPDGSNFFQIAEPL